jgi:hypothetical protein
VNAPEVNKTVGGYEFNWPDLKLSIQVSHLSTQKNELRGQVGITTTHPDFNNVLLPQTTINFSSLPTRSKLAAQLQKDFDGWPWGDIVDKLTADLYRLVFQGEPVGEIWTNAEIARPEFLLKPVLYRGLASIIYGEKASLKSTLALVVYICLVLPWQKNPLGFGVPDYPVKVLYLDWETNKDTVLWNAQRLRKGLDLPDFPVHYRRCTLPIAQDLEQVQKAIADVSAEVVLLDSLGAAAGGELKDPNSALQFFSALRQLETTSLLIGQTSKDKETKVKSVFGSTFFEYYARNIFELRKAAQGEDEDELNVALFHRFNNLGKLEPPMGFRFSYGDDEIAVERRDARTVDEFLERMYLKTRLCELLKDGAMPIGEMAEILNSSEHTLRTTLNRHKDTFIKTEGGKWGLLASATFSFSK